jgi:alpha-D-ribose 1-methylphosphonate 5-triphosphate synthase subunit PhnI
MKNPIELKFAIFHGEVFLEVKTLVDWFESNPDTHPELTRANQLAAFTIKEMVKKAMTNPTRVMEEDEYLARKEMN